MKSSNHDDPPVSPMHIEHASAGTSPPPPQYRAMPTSGQVTAAVREAQYSLDAQKTFVDQPGLEVVPMESHKEYIRNDDYPEVVPDEPNVRQHQHRRLIWTLIAAVIATGLAIGLGVGLGLGLRHTSGPSNSVGPKNPSTSSGGGSTVNAAYLTTEGAFNGSGIAIASQSYGTGGYGTIVLYFQYHDGTVRNMQLLTGGGWIGGDYSTIVANDAKNATPISAVSYAMDQISTWHIFYIDRNNLIREKVNSNATNIWRDGPLNDLNLQAMNDVHVGLQSCWYGSDYGDAVYTHSPVQGQSSNYTPSADQQIGMHLWYGSSPTVLQEVAWEYGSSIWTKQETFNFNGHAGVGCYSWGPGSVSYVMLVDCQNSINVYWKDLNTALNGTENHPINVWTNSSISIANAYQNTSLGYTNYFYHQNQQGIMTGQNISWAAENTTIKQSDTFTIPGDNALAGTHFSVTAIPNNSGGNSLLVFNQVNGSDIVEWTRDLNAGQWFSNALPLPWS